MFVCLTSTRVRAFNRRHMVKRRKGQRERRALTSRLKEMLLRFVVAEHGD